MMPRRWLGECLFVSTLGGFLHPACFAVLLIVDNFCIVYL